MELAYFGCSLIVKRINEEHDLPENLDIDSATDALWMLISIANWENLVIDRGWSQEKYAAYLKQLALSILLSVDTT